ncbi:fusicoccadiene synthase [Beauveria bassiana ARSEF 2860]|uniref:Fusicoccadiene synthase n=1 Tax=Beauveria bassiana (strain ARSEF 2860) TaxID=655819 RepID=J4W7N1_BEAB2|nr:fusicoccadiene synthase [Beauveria bassiana ARSEF 2860]EJP66250.1 fusicoccadiene synthase [Beauveria bassiana ARSEF 2860]
MEYHYSHLIDSSSYDSEGLSDGIPLRVHRNQDLEEMGAIRLHNDWRKFVGPLPTNMGGSIGPIYSFTAVTMPECRPERLELVSYMVELAFLNDDALDTTEVPEDFALTSEMVYRRNEVIDKAMVKDHKPGKGQILANFAKEIMSIDPVRTSDVMKYLKRDLRVPKNGIKFKDFDDFLEYRVVQDSGSDFLLALSIFGMQLTIPKEEEQTCFELTRPVWAASILTNDLQSWAKEYKIAQMQDKSDMMIMTNGIWVLMQQHSIDIEEAKLRIRQKVKDFVAQYVMTLEKIKVGQDLSLDSRRLIEAMQYMISGNLIWGNLCPRYHSPTSKLSDFQLSRMKNVLGNRV